MRVWHSRWSWLKLIVAAESVAGNTRIGMFTSEILRKPFQVGRAAMLRLSTNWRVEVRGWWLETVIFPTSNLQPPPSNLQPPVSKEEAGLELKHARRVDVRERRQSVRGGAGGDDLAERRVHGAGIPIDDVRGPGCSRD